MSLIERRVGLIVLGLAGVILAGCGGSAEPVDRTAEIFAEFSKRLDDYTALRNRLADSVGPLDPTKSQAEIASRSARLAAAIAAARPDAKPGDIFTVEAAAIIATLIKQEYDRRPAAVLEARGDAQDELPDFIPKVNQLYPTQYPLATFPASLLPILPRLPKDLEYRIVTGHLILRDIEANLTIDLMPHAVPNEKLP